MTDQNTPTDDASEAPVRRTRARRVATSGTTTPKSSAAPVTAPAETATTAGAGQPEKSAPDQDVAPTAAPRTRSRRATSASRAATPASSDTPAAEPAAPAIAAPLAAEPAQEQAEPATTRPKRTRRASSSTASRAAASQQAASSDAAAQTPAPAEAAATPAEEPAATTKAAGRRRSSRSASAAATAVTSSPADAQAPAADQASTAGAGSLDVLAELGAPRSASAPRKEEATRMPATALLFQAPDPTARPKRRRAVAPAGPPRHDDEASGELDEEALEAAAALAAALAATEPTEADEDESAETGADESDEQDGGQRRRRRRGGRGRRSRSGADQSDESSDDGGDVAEDEAEPAPAGRGRRRSAAAQPVVDEDAEDDDEEAGAESDESEDADDGGSSSSRRRRRRRRGSRGDSAPADEPVASTSTRTRTRTARAPSDEVTALKGSTRLEAKRQRRREGRDAGRRRTIVTESEFLARREAVERSMVVKEANDRVQIAVLEDGVLVEHFVSRSAQNGQSSMAGNVYLGRVQNVLPSMEAAFVDVGKGRNAVLYAGEVNWDAAGMEGQPRRIEQALKSGDSVLVQVTKDPIGHKGARLTSQITLAGRYLVYVPGGGMTGISRKLPENERARLKKLLKEIVPDAAGVIVRTAAEGASEEELRNDVQRLQDQWAAIEKKAKSASAPALLQGEPDLAIRVVRDIFNDDFSSLVVQGDGAWSMISEYVGAMAPDLGEKVSRWTGTGDVFAAHRIDEQLAKGMDRKVWLPSGGSLVIDRTEAMTVVDVNTGKFTGSGGTLEETVTRNNIEAAEEIVRQLRLRDIGGIIVIDFIDMVLESNRDLVLRRLVECLGRDRTKHQVAEVTSLGLVQMTRKRVGQGLVEAFSETCQHCNGRGFIVHSEPIDQKVAPEQDGGRPAAAVEAAGDGKRARRKKTPTTAAAPVSVPVLPEAREAVKATLATIAAAAAHAHEHEHDHDHDHEGTTEPSAIEPVDVEHTDLVHADGEHTDGEHADGEHADGGGQVEADPAQLELAETVQSVEAVEVQQVPAGD